MECLWITLADPDPATNGQLIYSKGLIESACNAGLDLCVVGLARSERGVDRVDGARLAWRLAEERRQPRLRRILSTTPEVALKSVSERMYRTLDRALRERTWEAIVFDSICSGWALEAVRRRCAEYARAPTIVHIAHNHERTVARRIADASRGMRRILKELDALKVARLERRLIAAADLVTSNTPEDCRTFIAEAGGRTVAFVPPGYGGPRVASRTIGAEVPRRAVVVGSFDWPPKRISLERFLAAGASILAQAGIELQIVGSVDPAYLGSLRARYPSVAFVGPVPDVLPYMASARIALVPDLLGGFKLKGLDYAFNRIPILAMRVALPGMPLKDGDSVSYFDSHEALARGVVAQIDDYATLNRRQEAAFSACAARFDWHSVGRHLLDHIAAARRSSAAPASEPTTAAVEAAAD